MGAQKPHVWGVTPSIVAPVAAANPGDELHGSSPRIGGAPQRDAPSYDPAPAFPVPPNRAGSNRGRRSAPPPPPNFLCLVHDPEMHVLDPERGWFSEKIMLLHKTGLLMPF